VILNAFSVLAAFAALLRVIGGFLVLVLGVAAWRRLRRDAAAPRDGEGRYFLLVMLCATLVGIAVVSWPLLYLVLQSYVGRWPGVMCIEGVTRIGTGSIGAASHLPGLVRLLEVAKPALVFVSGAWVVLHLANRRAPGGRLTGRVVGALLLCGAAAALDGGAELAYLFIPKQERLPAAGCCGVPDEAVLGPVGGPAPAWLSPAYFSLGLALVVALSLAARKDRVPATWLAVALVGALASLPLGLEFLGRVAAPALLHLPHHSCAYCLIAKAPESLVGIGLHVAGAFAVGWACVARWVGAEGDGGIAAPLLRVARFGYLGSLAMAGVGLASS
jgi:hypothetical protein